MENLLKSWKTTLLGIVIVGVSVYHYFTTGEQIEWTTVIMSLVGIGFVVSKDSTDSHTKR